MKASQYILATEKQNPADAVVVSHQLMVRAGLIRKSSAGLYHYLPPGWKVLQKIQDIIREEMNRSGAIEFSLPILTPEELWQQSGRWSKMGKEMFRQKDRHELQYALGPTHEESFVSVLKPILKSYKDLPKNVYQMHTKFRDEIRPRYGVIRSREFIMKDAYSFHIDEDSLAETYELMRATYRRIFARCGLKTIPVQADSGNMGGSGSEEFMVLSPIGEETLAICANCGYSGNVEKTPLVTELAEMDKSIPPVEVVATPALKTIKEVSDFLQVDADRTIKAVLYRLDEERNAIIYIRGDRDINEVKLKNLLDCQEMRPLTEQEIEPLGLLAGFIGPIASTDGSWETYFDASLDPTQGYVAGANQSDKHVRNYVLNRDYGGEISQQDFSLVRENDACPNCGQSLQLNKGIEVGHIFKLGRKYSQAFEMMVMDKQGKPVVPTMGCYGIGVNRTMATIIEQGNDEKGIIWPISVAPFEVALVSLTKDVKELAEIGRIYDCLQDNGIDTFWDDRNLSPGFKLRDSEMLGIPIKLVFGKNFGKQNQFSITLRKDGEEQFLDYVNPQNILTLVQKKRDALFQQLINEWEATE